MCAIPKGSVLLLHACCHNPTGVDIRGEQWDEVIKIVAERRLIPFLDSPTRDSANGIEEDAQVARRFAEELPVVLVAMSFSKSFSLYASASAALGSRDGLERIGAGPLQSQAHDPHKLLEPADSRREDRRRRARFARSCEPCG